MSNGSHPPKKLAELAGKKAKALKSRRARPLAKSRSRLAILLQGQS
jgi:hypothetical protein